MRHGLSEGDDHDLRFALGADEETETQLAQLESFLVEAFGDRERASDETSPEEEYFPKSIEELEDSDTDEAILEALRHDEDET